MTHFEYLSVAVSLILSFALVRLIDGLWPAIKHEGRYVTHYGWVAFKLYSSVLFWWSMWLYNENEWTIVTFVWMLIGPLLLYGKASLLAPRNAAEITDWQAYYFSIARPF